MTKTLGNEFIGRECTHPTSGWSLLYSTHPAWVWTLLVGYLPNMGMECIGRVLTQNEYGLYW